jgi:hypothetical protein
MTWIVGKAMPFGFAAAVSDTRVTTPKGLKDCLQKIFPVGRFMALGFAGSVVIGLEMVETLSQLLNEAGPDGAWEPAAVAEWWPKDAKAVFKRLAPFVDDPLCELLLLAAHPSEHTGNAAWPRCYVYRFRSPAFEAELAAAERGEPSSTKVIGVPGTSTAMAIGCGNELARYREILEHHFEVPTGGPITHSMLAAQLLVGVRLTIVNNPSPDISPFLQLCTVTRGRVEVRNADGKRYGPNSEVDDYTVPNLARTPSELAEALKNLGGTARARC